MKVQRTQPAGRQETLLQLNELKHTMSALLMLSSSLLVLYFKFKYGFLHLWCHQSLPVKFPQLFTHTTTSHLLSSILYRSITIDPFHSRDVQFASQRLLSAIMVYHAQKACAHRDIQYPCVRSCFCVSLILVHAGFFYGAFGYVPTSANYLSKFCKINKILDKID